jgi:hypothetical protein
MHRFTVNSIEGDSRVGYPDRADKPRHGGVPRVRNRNCPPDASGAELFAAHDGFHNVFDVRVLEMPSRSQAENQFADHPFPVGRNQTRDHGLADNKLKHIHRILRIFWHQNPHGLLLLRVDAFRPAVGGIAAVVL